jgi:hypothetical protein
MLILERSYMLQHLMLLTYLTVLGCLMKVRCSFFMIYYINVKSLLTPLN